ncbi:MAG: type II toxin-antitoxin system RelE/ParE family toxin [Thermodesulfobacteriota bacterium]
MDSYKIDFKPSVEKDLRNLSGSTLVRVMKRVEGLKDNPLPPQATKLSRSERLYRLRVGDYRIVYEVDRENEQITIHYIRHRRKIYRDL